MRKILFFVLFFALETQALAFSGSKEDAQLWLNENFINLFENCDPQQLENHFSIQSDKIQPLCKKINSKSIHFSLKDIQCNPFLVWFPNGRNEQQYKCQLLLMENGKEESVTVDIAVDNDSFKYRAVYAFPIDFDVNIVNNEEAWLNKVVPMYFSKECRKNLDGVTFRTPGDDEKDYKEAIEAQCDFFAENFPKNCQVSTLKSGDSWFYMNLSFSDEIWEFRSYDVDLICSDTHKKKFYVSVVQTKNGPRIASLSEREAN